MCLRAISSSFGPAASGKLSSAKGEIEAADGDLLEGAVATAGGLPEDKYDSNGLLGAEAGANAEFTAQCLILCWPFRSLGAFFAMVAAGFAWFAALLAAPADIETGACPACGGLLPPDESTDIGTGIAAAAANDEASAANDEVVSFGWVTGDCTHLSSP